MLTLMKGDKGVNTSKAIFGFFVAALMQAARSGEIGLNGKEDSHG